MEAGVSHYESVRNLSDSSQKRARHVRQANRLIKRLRNSIDTLTKFEDLGENEFLSNLAFRQGFEEFDLVLRKVRFKSVKLGIICVPTRVWFRKDLMVRVYRIRAQATAMEQRCLIVPQSAVDRKPRAANSEMIARSRSTHLDTTSRMAVLGHLASWPNATLEECAALVRGADPVGAVLRLVYEGILEMDLQSPITPSSKVRLTPSEGPHL